MSTLDDLYGFYCRRRGCKPNTSFSRFLQEEYERQGQQRVLESIDLSKNYVGKKGIIPVLDLVKNIKTVKKIDVSNNMLEHEQLDHLVYCLVMHPSIEEVDISNNSLHEGSVGHILKLLETNQNITSFHVTGNDFTPSSITLINEQLEKNESQKANQENELPSPVKRKYFHAELQGSLEVDTSGGHMHFSTWWKNPQYIMRTSRKSQVRVIMDVSDAKVSRQAGFFIFRSDGTRKVIEVDTDTIIAESTVDSNHCHATFWVEEQVAYAIMPYTFYPERTLSFTLTAELCEDKSMETEGWVTLDPVDPALDWIVNISDGEWTDVSSGGPPEQYYTWYRNPMFRLQYAGSNQAYRMVSPATILVKLTKSVDPDKNDDKYIGFDVVTTDPTGKGTPPIYCKDEFIKCTCPHEHCTTVSASFIVPCAALDLFLVPSTKKSGELGSFTVTVFSSVPLAVTPSVFPHGWNYRAVNGVWDENNCGGSREYSMSWKCNPSVALLFDGDKTSPDLTLFLEVIPSSSDEETIQNDKVGSVITESELTSEEIQNQIELKEFMQRHQSDHIEGSISIVEASSPLYRALYSSDYKSGPVAHLAVSNVSGNFLVLLTTRYAGQLGKFKLHIFSSQSFVVDGIETLASRERQSQLLQYSEETQARRKLNSTELGNHLKIEDSEDVMMERNQILRKCLTTGEKYIDRDFPRGGSSLWLDPESKPPSGFPKDIQWKRPTDVMEKVVFLPDFKTDCPFPYSKREWFASVAYAISTKPRFLRMITIGYEMIDGFAQFRFFKDGKWIVVTIDDYLPFDNTTELCMGHPESDKADFFFPLLEKAYAKAHRCYEALERKVTPELSTVEVMCQGIMDLSGCITVNYMLSPSNQLHHKEQERLWMKVKTAVKPDVLITLLLRSDSNGASERCSLGILSDHLYPILDARFVEGQRLVKLCHWRQSGEINWSGKWRANSPKWTDTLREILEFKEDDKETFWLSFDEVLFYFTDIIMTAGTENNSWVLSDFSDCPKGCESRLVGGSQFTLELGEFPPDMKSTQILIGLHQLDPRAKILRDKNALATYRTAIGLAVIATKDNTIILKKVKENEVIKRVEPCKCRDTLCPLTVDLENVSGKKRITLIAFKEDPKAPNATFLLSAWSEHCTVKIIPVEPDKRTSVSGEWPSEYPVGNPSSLFWRDCPQYFIFPSETTEVTLSLHQEVPVNELPKSIGFTVHRATTCRSFLEYDPDSVVLLVHAEVLPSITGSVRLLGMKERRGMPYIIVPFSSDATPGGKFRIEAIANRSLKLCSIDPKLDWHREKRSVSFSLLDGSVGGSPRFSSWRSSPQFALTFPFGCHGRLFISLTNDDVNDTFTEIGMMVLRGDNQWEKGQRRKLVIAPEDMIGRSDEKIGGVTLDCEVDVEPECTLILVVYASMPYREASVTIGVYSASPMEMNPVKEWKQVAMVEGSWELGYTAGGGADGYSNWVNNPFVALNTFRRTQIVALLLQYPRGPDKPIVKRAGKKKAFLPPIIINPHNRMEVALDLNVQDNEMTPIATTPYTKNSEVTLVATVPIADSLPFVFVPHTKVPEENGDFKLFVYADSVIELYPLSKERIPYV
ncbi:calpain cysteine peptidase [Trypanosoma theileri]|uniref:Calpain cysteine peptidase n=1 Tax=Trypanosoma theileri TaxID=67003 RepID=A0A1X0NXB1_9TRYP|nr:calpain cysteine peptidase [Trypanosoma theileri]ORC89345.1 calpain cysteine peptidase [Trypanosoma theileri]